MSGFVYVMSNPAMPNIVKVGMTTRHPTERARELKTTGVPCPFDIEAALWCGDPRETESAVHDRLCRSAITSSREFFYGTHIVDEAKAALYSEAYLVADHDFAHCELIIDPGDAAWIVDKMGLMSEELTDLIRYISKESWGEAKKRRNDVHRRGRQRRLDASSVEGSQ